MGYARSFDVAVAATTVKKASPQFKEMKRLARRANRDVGEHLANFAVVWLGGGRPVIRFFNERAAQQFRATAPAGTLA
jgi:hypothetical protein